MKQLKLGKITSKELADWFGYSYNTYRSKKKPELILQLKDYCSFKEVYGGIEVTEIFFEEYEGDLSHDVQTYLEQVKPCPLNSIANISEEIASNTQYAHLSKSQRERRMAKAGIVAFGITTDESSKGLYGTRNYQWSIKLYNEDKPYRNLTEEEQRIFDEYTTAIFAEKPEIAQKMALLDEEFETTDMTKEQYLNHKDRLAFKGAFDQIVFNFKAETGLQLIRATEHDILESVF